MNKFIDKVFPMNAVYAGFIADWLSEMHLKVVDVKISQFDAAMYVLVQLQDWPTREKQ